MIMVSRVASRTSAIRHEPPPLSITRTRLQRLREEEPQVVEHFEQWLVHRPKTIETLEILIKEFNSLFRNCNGGRNFGKAGAIIGLMSGAIGTVLKFTGHESESEYFIKFSKWGTVGGTAVIASSSLLEMGLSQRTMNKLTDLIEEDIILTEPLRRWVEFANDVNERFSELLQCDIYSPNFNKVLQVLSHCINLIKVGCYDINNLIRDLSNCKVKGVSDLTKEVAQQIIDFFRKNQKNSEIILTMGDICEMLNVYPTFSRFIVLGGMVYCQINGIALPSIPFCSEALRCAFDTIKLLKSLVAMLSFADIYKRQSEFSESLEMLKAALINERRNAINVMNERENNFDLGNLRLALPE